MRKWDICEKNDVNINLVLTDGDNKAICWECNNNLMAEELGIQLMPFDNGVYEYTGLNGQKHKFRIYKIVNPGGIGFEANEITEEDDPGYKVCILGELDCDQQDLFKQLEGKIKKTISAKYLETASLPDGQTRLLLKNDDVVGRLEYIDFDGEVPLVIIDGQVFSWEELGRMLNIYEGFQFKLSIHDIIEDAE